MIPKLKSNSNIVLISSIASKNGIGSNVAYSSSKAALNNLAISLTKILGGKTQINCIAPGLMKTKFTSKFSEKYFKNINQIHLQKNLQHQMMLRMLQYLYV